APPVPLPDPVEDAAVQRPTERTRPEQRLTEHDRKLIEALPPSSASRAFTAQPNEGAMKGFDFARDPLNSLAPGVDPNEIVKADKEARPAITRRQRELLEERYIL